MQEGEAGASQLTNQKAASEMVCIWAPPLQETQVFLHAVVRIL